MGSILINPMIQMPKEVLNVKIMKHMNHRDGRPDMIGQRENVHIPNFTWPKNDVDSHNYPHTTNPYGYIIGLWTLIFFERTTFNFAW